jgi:CheY-like chemotaxis protein
MATCEPSRDEVQNPADRKSPLLAESQELLARISPAELETIAERLRSQVAALGEPGPASVFIGKKTRQRRRALIIDADAGAAQVTADIVTSLGHDYDIAASQSEARALLVPSKYAYILLDLEIPVHKARNHARVQHGVNLLVEIRADGGFPDVPVITTLAEHRGNTDIAVWVMRKGAADFLRKPFADVGYTLEKAITDALARSRGEWPSPLGSEAPRAGKKRGDRAAAIEGLREELVDHIRAARDHACDSADRGRGLQLLPRPLRKDLSRHLDLPLYTVSRCFQDSDELRVLWDIAGDVEQVMKFGR